MIKTAIQLKAKIRNISGSDMIDVPGRVPGAEYSGRTINDEW